MDLGAYIERARSAEVDASRGFVCQAVGLVVEVAGVKAATGDRLVARVGTRALTLEVLGFRDGRLLAAPLGSTAGLRQGVACVRCQRGHEVGVGPALLGRVIDAFGEPLDGGPPPPITGAVPLRREPPAPFGRRPVAEAIDTGVRVLDALLPVGRGQRLGLFAGTGVGKSTLLGMLTRRAKADVVVVGLIGERGREVGDFVRNAVGKEGLARSIVVVATSDAPPLVRAQGALRATAIAEHFRDQGAHVMLLMDSVTRYAMALREATLAAGEPPVSKGYTPSVFAALPLLFERAGNGSGQGSITAIYTVLVEGDDLHDPIVDAVRGTLDGHIVLSRELAQQGIFPAVDVLGSVSRAFHDIAPPEQRAHVQRVRELLGAHRDAADLLKIGAYVAGSDPRVDAAVLALPRVERLIRQDIDEASPRSASLALLRKLGAGA
ncbi:MAG: FliI/YscN family ATPase [Myxococcales bacterium]|nr:FliI/YscN family ATPase [Myxococcales bacterium]